MAEAEGSTPFVSTLGFDKPLTLCRRLFLKRKGNTMAELTTDEKNAISHRFHALEHLSAKLTGEE